jgi:hypothetical protein
MGRMEYADKPGAPCDVDGMPLGDIGLRTPAREHAHTHIHYWPLNKNYGGKTER